MPSDDTTPETYIDPCPKCGDRLLGVSKEEFIAHLRENGETLAARIQEEMVVDEADCADATLGAESSCADATGRDESGFADATGYQKEECPESGELVAVYVESAALDNGTVAKKTCESCGHRWTEYTAPPSTEDSLR